MKTARAAAADANSDCNGYWKRLAGLELQA
jgi:hypothetical protein